MRTVNSQSDKKQGRAARPVSYKSEHSQTAFLTEHVIDYIDQFTHNSAESDNNSWCVHLSYFRPHPPFVAPEPYNQMYDPASFDPPDRPVPFAIKDTSNNSIISNTSKTRQLNNH